MKSFPQKFFYREVLVGLIGELWQSNCFKNLTHIAASFRSTVKFCYFFEKIGWF